ncbi:MAG: EamA family transporter [Burkholderiales bacterium]|nr:EamA family transporter [Burkholderiales bacterium]
MHFLVNILKNPKLSLAGMITSMTIAQVMFKFAGNFSRNKEGMLQFYSNPWIWYGLFASFIGMLCWLLTLRKLPLAVAYPWTALVYVFTPLASALFFSDVIRPNYLLGITFIVTGIFIIARGKN